MEKYFMRVIIAYADFRRWKLDLIARIVLFIINLLPDKLLTKLTHKFSVNKLFIDEIQTDITIKKMYIPGISLQDEHKLLWKWKYTDFSVRDMKISPEISRLNVEIHGKNYEFTIDQTNDLYFYTLVETGKKSIPEKIMFDALSFYTEF